MTILSLLVAAVNVYGQPADDLPKDFLSQDFHRGTKGSITRETATEFRGCIFRKRSA